MRKTLKSQPRHSSSIRTMPAAEDISAFRSHQIC